MKYYYNDGTNRFGPMSVEKLLISDINAKTLVWCDGMTEWIEAGEVPEIAEALKSVPPPIPRPEPKPTPESEPTVEEQTPTPPPERPKSWLLESILATIFCCLPFGIIGIINALDVESRYNAKEYDKSIRASNEAKRWCKYALIVGLICLALPLLLIITSGFALIGPLLAVLTTMTAII